MKELMMKAWEIYRTLTEGTHREKLSMALKMAWNWVRSTEKKNGLETLLEMGANRWTKGGHDRLYLSKCGAAIMGLECSYYKTGNISCSSMDGEKISHAEARRVMCSYANAYIDLTSGKVCGTAGKYAEAFEEKVSAIYAA